MIFIEPVISIDQDLMDHFSKKGGTKRGVSKYFAADCSSSKQPCNVNEDLDYLTVSSTVNAVYSVAHGIHNLLECNTSVCKDKRDTSVWAALSKHIQEATFLGVDQRKFSFFDARKIKYEVWNIVAKGDNQYDFRLVGGWDKTAQGLNESQSIFWNTKNHLPPKSSCSQTCQPGKFVFDAFSSSH